ncbi:MAG: glucose-1-phosphate cytidylyltransferase [Bacteroidales bacterium]|nr:glucose-1-phosphate cytidylyltransferase [Bacteroidales bacterium]
MKVIIFAGGWGSRLGQLTDFVPKPMIKIGNKPILWHIMKIYSSFGFNEFIIALGVKGEVIKEYFYKYEAMNSDFTINLKDKSIKYLNNHDETNWKVTLVDTGLNTLKGGRIKRLEHLLNSDTNMLTYGDGLAEIDIKKLHEFHMSHGKIVTLTGVHPPARFGELIVQDDKVNIFSEKSQTSTGMINGGFMVFNKELLNYLNAEEDCDFEKGALEELAMKGEVMVYKDVNNWECMDHERDVVHLNKLWDENKAFWKIED